MRSFLLFLFLNGIMLHAFGQKTYLPVKVKHQWGVLEVTPNSAVLDPEKRFDNLGDLNLPWLGQPGSQSGLYHLEQAGNLGLAEANYNIIVKPAWQEIHPINDQYFLVAKDGVYNIIDRNNKLQIKEDNYQAINFPTEDLSFFMLKKEGKWGVRKKGQKNWAIQPEYQDIQYLEVGTEGLFKVKSDAHWQLVDWSGDTLKQFPGSFDRIMAISQNHLAFQTTSRKSKWSIQNLEGKELLLLDPTTSMRPLNQALFGYKEKGNGTFSVLVMRKEISPLVEKFQEIKPVNDKLVYYRLGNTNGFIQANGTLLELEHLVDIEMGSGKLIRIKRLDNQKWGLYDSEETKLSLACQYDSIGSFQGSFAKLFQAGKVGLVNQSSAIVAEPKFETLAPITREATKIYGYWKDSVQIVSIGSEGNVVGTPKEQAIDASSSDLNQYYWVNFEATPQSNKTGTVPSIVKASTSKGSVTLQDMEFPKEQDTLWIEEHKSFWKLENNEFQMFRQKQVEIVLREKSGASKKKKKSKKSATPPKTTLVNKWIKQGPAYRYLKKAAPVDWTLAYQDNTGLVTNELVSGGRTKYSFRKINIIQNATNTTLPDIEMLGIRLSDFADGLPYAAFMDLDGKLGLINKAGQQLQDTSGQAMRFTYIAQPSEGLLQVCHSSSAFSQIGVDLNTFLQSFNAQVVKGSGTYTSELRSTQAPKWGYIEPGGQLVIPFEYEMATPFELGMAINKRAGKWGGINFDNTVKIPFEYDAIYKNNSQWQVVKKDGEADYLYYDTEGRSFLNEDQAKYAAMGYQLFPISNNETPAKFGYANPEGVIVIPFQYDEATYFMDELATVKEGKTWYFINPTGGKAITIDPDLIGITEVGRFKDGLCPIKKTTILNKESKIKYGYLNTEGKLAIEPQFDRAEIFQNEVAVVDSIVISGGSVVSYKGLIDQKGNLITNYEFKRIFPFNGLGYAKVIHSNLDRQGVIGKDGKPVAGQYFYQVQCFKEGIAGWDGKNWKVFNYAGQELTLPVKDISGVNYFKDQDLFVRDKSNSWYHLVIEADQAKIQEDSFQLLQPFQDGFAFARLNKQALLYGRNQSWVIPERGQYLKFWSDQLLGIKTSSYEYYANLGLQNAFGRTFNEVDKFDQHTAIVKYHGQSGVINRNGLFVLPPSYQAISREPEGYFKAQVAGPLYGLRAADGTEIIPAQYERISYLNKDIIQVEYGDFVGYYRSNGEPLWVMEE